MIVTRVLFVLVLSLLSGCRPPVSTSSAETESEKIYQLIISDLRARESPDGLFDGDEVWIAPEFAEGDSLFYSWDGDMDVDDELIDGLKRANRETADFPAAEKFGPHVSVRKIESFHDLFYYRDGAKPVAAKCLVQFWRPGFSANGKRAIVRFFYGPSPHGATRTYLLERTDRGWQILSSTITRYL